MSTRRAERPALFLLAGVLTLGVADSSAPVALRAADGEPASPRNIIFIICDQEAYRLYAKDDFQLPARQALAQRGVTFRNHYIASAVCTPSRAAIFTGTTPQVNGVSDQMSFGFLPSLSPKRPNMGSILKGLGYQTAYFGKFELSLDILHGKKSENTNAALQPYGFDLFNVDGDAWGGPYQGFATDAYFAGESVRWLRSNAPALRKNGKPFFMVASFVNPHDIMFADTNSPGRTPVQKAISRDLLAAPPKSAIYERQWDFVLPRSLQESLNGPGMPAAIAEYDKAWAGVFGVIPRDRKDMWRTYYNYYLNCLRDNDRNLQHLVEALDDMDLWKDTVVVFTADHGEMGGAHGGLRGKGPLCYEGNAHVPLIMAHPDAKGGKDCAALTSHLDLLPTLISAAGIPERQRPATVKRLSGRDFSRLLSNPDNAALDALRPGILFSYVGLSTVDARYYVGAFARLSQGKQAPPVSEIDLNKRGFLSFVFDGRYKLARFYAPSTFNTPKTLDQLFKHNDVQLFDLKMDPDEMRNLALDRDRNQDNILRLNGLLNDLMAREVGANDGSFLPEAARPKGALTFE